MHPAAHQLGRSIRRYNTEMQVVLACDQSDRPFANRLLGDLAAVGMRAKVSIEGGRRKAASPTRPDRAQAILLPILSAASAASANVARLLEEDAPRSREYRSCVVPILRELCNLPAALRSRVPIDFSVSYGNGFADLLAQLEAFGRVTGPVREISAPTVDVAHRLYAVLKAPSYWNELRHHLAADAFVEDLLRLRLAKECPECDLEFVHAVRRSGVDMILIAGHEGPNIPWLLQCKTYRSNAAIQAVDTLVPMLFERRLAQELDPALVSRAVTVVSSNFDALDTPSVDCWRIAPKRFRMFVNWLSATSEFGETGAKLVENARERHSQLTDRRFTGMLSDTDKLELAKLEGILDTEEDAFYGGPEDSLRVARRASRLSKYSALVDKKFLTGLNDDEEREFLELRVALDADEGAFYEPLKQRLREMLRQHAR
jgi:hypothetical protein